MKKDFYTVKDIAEEFNVKEKAIRALINSGDLSAAWVCNKWIVTAKDLQTFIESKKKPKISDLDLHIGYIKEYITDCIKENSCGANVELIRDYCEMNDIAYSKDYITTKTIEMAFEQLGIKFRKDGENYYCENA